MQARRLGWISVALLIAATLVEVHVARHPGNAAVPSALGSGRTGLSPGVTYMLMACAALLGGTSVACGLRAMRSGWHPSPWRILCLGLIAAACLAAANPVGTADIGSYAAYGRMEAQGIDSYVTSPRAASAGPLRDFDISEQFYSAAEDPWRATPNVYGPVGTWIFKQAAQHGSHGVRDTMMWLHWMAFSAFALTGLLLLGCVSGPEARTRAAMLWTANPLLALQLVGGAHLDVFVAFFVVVSLACARKPLLRGLSAALAVATKATAGWAALGLVLGKPRRGRMRRLMTFSVSVAVLYETASGHVFDQAHRASRYVSAGTPWRWVASLLEVAFSHSVARVLVVAAALAATMALATAIAVAFSRWPSAGKATPQRAARSALVPMLAWTLVAPYQLPWYDAVVWALLAASVAMGVDWLILLHTMVLTLAYLPGRVLDLGQVPHDVQVALRSGLAPVVVGFCAMACVWSLKRPVVDRSPG